MLVCTYGNLTFQCFYRRTDKHTDGQTDGRTDTNVGRERNKYRPKGRLVELKADWLVKEVGLRTDRHVHKKADGKDWQTFSQSFSHSYSAGLRGQRAETRLFHSNRSFPTFSIGLQHRWCRTNTDWGGGGGFARGLVAGWAGQSGVLAPWDMTAVAAPGFVGTFPPLAACALTGVDNAITQLKATW